MFLPVPLFHQAEGEELMLSLGLDISSTSTGVVLLNDISLAPVFQGIWAPPPGLSYVERGDWQANKMLALLEDHEPDRIMIEGYSLGSTNGAEPLITVGGIMRYVLFLKGYTWTDVAPTRLKKYAGAKLKQDMKVAVYKRWEFEHSSDDVIDAYVLSLIGVALETEPLIPVIVAQKEVLNDLANPTPKKRRSSKKTTA